MSGAGDRGSTRTRREKSSARTVKAVHGVRQVAADPQFELDMAADLRERVNNGQLADAFTQYANGASYIDLLMRRICLRALVKKLGSGVTIQRKACLTYPVLVALGRVRDSLVVGSRCLGLASDPTPIIGTPLSGNDSLEEELLYAYW